VITVIQLDEKNRMLRVGFGLHDGCWFLRIDLWWVGYRLTKKKNELPSRPEPIVTFPMAPQTGQLYFWDNKIWVFKDDAWNLVSSTPAENAIPELAMDLKPFTSEDQASGETPSLSEEMGREFR
jgi:hypothetical protein